MMTDIYDIFNNAWAHSDALMYRYTDMYHNIDDPPDTKDNDSENDDILDTIVTYQCSDSLNGYIITAREEIELRINKIFNNNNNLKLKNYGNNYLYNNCNSCNPNHSFLF